MWVRRLGPTKKTVSHSEVRLVSQQRQMVIRHEDAQHPSLMRVLRATRNHVENTTGSGDR